MKVPQRLTGEEIHLEAQREQTQDSLTFETGVLLLPVLLFFAGCCLVGAQTKAQEHCDRLVHEATINLEIPRRSGNEAIWLHRYGALRTPFFAAIGVFIVCVMCGNTEVMCGIEPKGQVSRTVQVCNYASGQKNRILRTMPLIQQPHLLQENALIATRKKLEVGTLNIIREAKLEKTMQQCIKEGEVVQASQWSGRGDQDADSAVLHTTRCSLRSFPPGGFVWQCIEFCRFPPPSRLSRHPTKTPWTVTSTITIKNLNLEVSRSTEKIRGSRRDGGILDSEWGPSAIQVRFPHYLRVHSSRETRGRVKTQRWWSKRY